MAERHHHAEHGHRHSHSHAGAIVGDKWWIDVALLIILTFFVIEIIGGLIPGSPALLADGGHMVSDAAALGMS